MSYYLGIDGGGSKTTCAVGNEVSHIVTVEAGPSNITRVGEARARESLHKAITDACVGAGITPKQVKRACIGAAGAGREEVAGVIKKIVAELVPGEIEVVGDMPIALEAAFGEGPGIVVEAGTGSFAYGRNAKGRTARAGGWGFAISDEGSAHWIGRTAVSALLRAIDREIDLGIDREIDVGKDAKAVAGASTLFQEFKVALKLNSFDEFVRTANSNPDFAALFPAILAAAEGGVDVAKNVLDQAGAELAEVAGIVVRRLFAEGDAAIPLAMAGGVFRHSQRVRKVFCGEVQKLDRRLEANPQVVEPVMGALAMARRRETA